MQRCIFLHGIIITHFFNFGGIETFRSELSHSDRNGGISHKKRKNSAKIGLVGSYEVINE